MLNIWKLAVVITAKERNAKTRRGSERSTPRRTKHKEHEYE